MKNSRTLLAYSTSALAVAACLILPGVAGAQTAGAAATNAQPSTDVSDEVVVTGIRASLERSIAIKRDSTGVVDAISSEDIGKFPDTNLAESLQRISGVSIDRRNGEGAEVTVRGFGPQYNLVTLNGRQLAASDQTPVGGDENADFGRNTSRSFDFSNLASEGVKTLEVYKTGKAGVPSGGIGATINVVTRRPLDAGHAGVTGSIGVKANYDTSADDCLHCGAHVTPQVSGLINLVNEDETFGVTAYGSYQKRNFSTIAATVNDWNVTTLAQFLAPGSGNVNAASKINNAPTDMNALVARPNDARYHFAEDSEQRINGQITAQWKPTDNFTVTADGFYARNDESERRSDESNWFNRPFDVVTFDSGHKVATTTYLHEVIAGETKDAGFEQQYRAQSNRLQDFGLNGKWEATDRLTVAVDGHVSVSDSKPNNPNGMSSSLLALSSPTLASHSWDYDGGFPVQTVVYADPATTSPTHPVVKGNGNGVLDDGDVGTQQWRQTAVTFHQNLKEARVDAGWKFTDELRFDFGGDYRDAKTRSTQYSYQEVLGDWGNVNPRDVDAIAPGSLETFCLVCRFQHNDPKASGDGLTAFRTEDAATLGNQLGAYYAGLGHVNGLTGSADDSIREKIKAAYGQLTWKGSLGGMDAGLVAGVRYEWTTVGAVSFQGVPQDIRWQSDNDFIVDLTATPQAVTGSGKYHNFLPSVDFNINFTDKIIGRLSYSRTISRPSYGNMFASTTASQPNDATAVGGNAGGSTGNPGLKPLASDNFDASLEWYFKPGSYVSAGGFYKNVKNFIGNAIIPTSLFGLRDPSSGAAGSRSGTAKTQLQALGVDVTDVNLFTYTALLQQNGGNTAAATTTFNANLVPGTKSLNQAFVDSTIGAVDIIADANDPLFSFNVNTPINNKSAHIYGFEVAGQYFLGNTGIGVAAQYTYVRGNVGIDVTADPTANQFALLGLSDTANATLIYDKHGISARVTYNWRAKFLSEANRGGSHNPVFTAPYHQIDANLSYDITPKIAVSLEGLNIFEEGVKTYARSTNEIYFIQEGEARYLVGIRYKF
ncbi:MAG TPA: TonB-dependent receptor [Sphingomonas sp.]|uniref:TonB-dependent receptor n=1 Tax=Sphingomonas sp. TaxID=28214 RepID=UPI002C3E40EC|nr:TonB-dependent receptor [Sphingomonas sp.]HMI17918.1 TonB-dependent receptor [Sphingomonas sp.]